MFRLPNSTEALAQELVSVLLEDFAAARQKFINGGVQPEVVDVALASFKELKQRQLLRGVAADIDRYPSFGDLQKAIVAAEGERREKERQKAVSSDYTPVIETAAYRVVIPRNRETAVRLGKGTKWCISALEDNRWARYAEAGWTHYFCLPKGSGEKFAFSSRLGDFVDGVEMDLRDSRDAEVDPFVFMRETGLDPVSFYKPAIAEKVKARLARVHGWIRSEQRRREREARRLERERQERVQREMAAKKVLRRQIGAFLYMQDDEFVQAMEPLRKDYQGLYGQDQRQLSPLDREERWRSWALNMRGIFKEILNGDTEETLEWLEIMRSRGLFP